MRKTPRMSFALLKTLPSSPLSSVRGEAQDEMAQATTKGVGLLIEIFTIF